MKSYTIHNRNLWKNDFEIHDDTGQAHTRLRAQSWWSVCSVVEGRHDTWTFKSDGWMMNYEVQDHTGHPVGKVKSHWSGTRWTITLSGETYEIKQYHWAASIYVLNDAHGQKLASVRLSHWGKPMGSLRTYGTQEPRREELIMSILAFISRRIQLNGYT